MPKLYLARHGECDWSGKEVWFGSDSHSTEQVLKAAKGHKVFEERHNSANCANLSLF